MPFTRKRQTVLTILSILLVVLILAYTARIYSIQIVNAKNYSSAAKGSAAIRTAVLKAPRGEIIDRYGRQVAINRNGYNIVLNKAYVKDNLNDVILAVLKVLKEYDCEWTDKLPMEKAAPYHFTKDSTDKLLSTLELAHYATAQNCFTQLAKRYELHKYSPDEQRELMGIRYSMEIADFSISYPFTLAEDVPVEVMRKISESGFLLDGITVDVVPFRQYTDTSLAVNLIGTVGPIFEEDWEEYKEKGYSYDDKVGKSGIELWAEKYLKGVDGEITYYLDASGNITGSEVTKSPIAGKTVMLTLDRNIQRTAQDELKNTVLSLQAQGGTAVAGAAVVVDVKSGGVICAANYPTYDLESMSQNYDKLLADKRKPLTNRAFQGVYPIGSTIKPIVALAAIENGHYNIGESINCVVTYNYFDDYKPSCMHYHGPIALTGALSKSCNYFFFELGKRVGALTLTDYFKQFGLGVRTGVEVDDSAGILTEPSGDGFGGDTLQIAIGQLNAFTPLQLANYAATFANGGKHYKATLIDKVVSYDLKTTYEDFKPTVNNEIKISKKAVSAVKEGMLSVTIDGTGSPALGDYPIKIGGKTGTSQVTKGADHSTFIVFAPYENPEIAISVVLEHGNSSFASGSLVRKILDSYFFADDNNSNDVVPYTVLD